MQLPLGSEHHIQPFKGSILKIRFDDLQEVRLNTFPNWDCYGTQLVPVTVPLNPFFVRYELNKGHVKMLGNTNDQRYKY